MRVLLYPWFGSTFKNYNKYIQTYKYLFGKETIVNTVPYKIPDAVFYKRWKNIRKGGLIEPEYNEYDCIHMISGGCLIAYNQINYLKKIDHSKIIFDSGPFFPCNHLTANFLYHNIKYIPKVAVKPIGNTLGAYWKYVEKYDIDGNMIKYVNWLNQQENSLCLINRTDPLLDIHKIDSFIEETNSNLVDFDAPHAFLLKDKDKYYQSLIDYLK